MKKNTQNDKQKSLTNTSNNNQDRHKQKAQKSVINTSNSNYNLRSTKNKESKNVQETAHKQVSNEFNNLKKSLSNWVDSIKNLSRTMLMINQNSKFQYRGNIFFDISIQLSMPTYQIRDFEKRFPVIIIQRIYLHPDHQRRGFGLKIIRFLDELGKRFSPRRFVLIQAIENKQWFQSMKTKRNYFPITYDDSSMIYVEDLEQIQNYRKQG